MSEIKHTPLPFIMATKQSGFGWPVINPAGNIVCHLPIVPNNYIEGVKEKLTNRIQATGELIVTACNAWYDIDALKARISELESGK